MKDVIIGTVCAIPVVLSVWFWFWLANVLNLGPYLWWGIPFISTGIASTAGILGIAIQVHEYLTDNA